MNYAPDHVTVNSFDDYTYDALGNVLTDTNQDGELTYTYNADSQLIQAIFTPNSTDPDGLTIQNLQYTYDAAGNRISVGQWHNHHLYCQQRQSVHVNHKPPDRAQPLTSTMPTAT